MSKSSFLMRWCWWWCWLGMFLGMGVWARGADSFPVRVEVDGGREWGEWKPVWRFFGADEPNYAYMENGRKLLGQLGALRSREVYFRAHNLLTSGDGTPALKWGSTGVYREKADGTVEYDWTILDRIFDTYLEKGVRPYAQIGFMPKELSVKPEPYQHRWTPTARYEDIYTGWAYPPRDYAKWGELVYQWVRHVVERYGMKEVESWYWQVWNEPNIGYWRGTPEEFRRLHDVAIDAVKRACPRARVGGPDTAGSGGKFMRDFLEHALRGTNAATGRVGTPLDFISFHAKGAPVFTNGHVRMGMAVHLRTVEDGFRIIASYPETKSKPIVIGESDPEGCAACQGPQLGYRNGTMYSSYTAASFVRKQELARKYGVNLEGALTWAFEFEDQPYFAGFRSLASNGIEKPVLNVFRMFARMGDVRLESESSGAVEWDVLLKEGVRGRPDVSALATRSRDGVQILLWHYHDDDVAGPDAEVQLELKNLGEGKKAGRVVHWRIDERHSNGFAAWRRMGSPMKPTPEQYAELEKAGGLERGEPDREVEVVGGKWSQTLRLPRQAVSLWEIQWR